jgi:hypothetical protein
MVEDARDATADDRLSDWRLDTVVVASVEVPVTVSVPLLTNDDVAVIDPPVIVLPVIVLKNEVTLLRIVAMRPVEVVVLVTVSDDAVVVARFVVPLTVNAVADALPSDDVPAMSVENVPVVLNKLVLVALVNDGLGVIPIVEVPLNTMLDPAVKYATGEL